MNVIDEQLGLKVDDFGFDIIRIEYSTESYINPCDEMETCHYDCYGRILLDRINDCMNTERLYSQTIGQISLSYYNIMLMQKKGESAFAISKMMDNKDKQWPLAYFFNYDGYDYTKEWHDVIFKTSTNHNLLIVDAFWIMPEWRGKGLCKYVINDVLHHFWGTCGLIALKAFPLQYAKDVTLLLPDFSTLLHRCPLADRFNEDKERVMKAFEKAGFKQYRQTDMMFMLPGLKNPTMNR